MAYVDPAERLNAGNATAEVVPILETRELLYALIAAIAPFVPASFVDSLISPSAITRLDACSSVSVGSGRKTLEVIDFINPFAVRRAPALAEANATPPAPATGAVASESSAVAPTSVSIGAIASMKS